MSVYSAQAWYDHVDSNSNDYGEVLWVRNNARHYMESAQERGDDMSRRTWSGVMSYAQERLYLLDADCELAREVHVFEEASA